MDELESKSDEDREHVEKATEAREGEKLDRKKRGRQRKIEGENVQEAEYMKNYLQKGNIMRYDLRFTGGRKVEHSPSRERKAADGKVESDINGRVIEAVKDKDNDTSSETSVRLMDRIENKVSECEKDDVSEEEKSNKPDDQKNYNERALLEKTNPVNAWEKNESYPTGRRGEYGMEQWADLDAAEDISFKEWYVKVWKDCASRLDKVVKENEELRGGKDRLAIRYECEKKVMHEQNIKISELCAELGDCKAKIEILENKIKGLEIYNEDDEGERGGSRKGKGCRKVNAGSVNDEGDGMIDYTYEENNNTEQEGEGHKNRHEVTEIGGEGNRYENGASEAGKELNIEKINETNELDAKWIKHLEKKEYMKSMPDALDSREYEWEMNERKMRKKNIAIKGIRTVGRGIVNEIKEIIRNKMGLEIYIKNIRAIGGGIVAELDSFANKIEIMKRKGLLNGMNLWLSDDFTEREIQVQTWIEKIVTEERDCGRELQTGYQKIKVQDVWYEWDEKKGEMARMGFQKKIEGKGQ